MTAREVRNWTRRDPQLAHVVQYIQNGWPSRAGDVLKAFWSRRWELTVEAGCILWGTCVIIPEKGRQRVLQELHEGHPGSSRMKSRARMYMWWPGMDQDIEKTVHHCNTCQKNPTTALGVAKTTMVPSACGFCRSTASTHVSGCN